MTDSGRSTGPSADDDRGPGLDGGSPPGIPQWVKVSGLIVVLALLAIGIMALSGGGGHGPGRHGLGGEPVEQTALQASAGRIPGDLGF